MDLARGLFAGHLTLEVASAAAIRSLMSELSALVRSAQRASCPPSTGSNSADRGGAGRAGRTE
jgi:hypothetical protein